MNVISKGNLHCYKKLKLNCWKLSFNFNSLSTKWEESFSVPKS